MLKTRWRINFYFQCMLITAISYWIIGSRPITKANQHSVLNMGDRWWMPDAVSFAAIDTISLFILTEELNMWKCFWTDRSHDLPGIGWVVSCLRNVMLVTSAKTRNRFFTRNIIVYSIFSFCQINVSQSRRCGFGSSLNVRPSCEDASDFAANSPSGLPVIWLSCACVS